MKSKQFAVEEEARRFEIEQRKQGAPMATIGGHIPDTNYDSTLAWITERSRKAAKNRMALASRYDPVAICEPIKFAPRIEPPKPAEIGDVIVDRGYVGNKIVQQIKRIVGV